MVQEKDLGQRVLEGFDPCFHATAGILFPLLLMMLCLRPQPLSVVLPPSSSEMETSRWSRES